MTEPRTSWQLTVAQAGTRLTPLVHQALQSVALSRWPEAPRAQWRILTNAEQASWELAYYLGIDEAGHHRYARIQVVATVDPHGELVTWQVNNGAEFLGLTDLTAYGLQRGVVYLLNEEYREWVTEEPLFPHANTSSESLWTRLKRLIKGDKRS